jgi:hypothetical protein
MAFQAKCAGGDKLPQNATTDALLSFGRQCLQDSGLVSREAEDLGSRLQFIEMNRDDKAHRFVVTWNAVLDGNRLAYLAMVLAIGVDALVFMAGLFGAAAVKSPLSDVPSPKARSAEQLESIIKNALGDERLENAELVLGNMRPMLGQDDNRSEVDLTHINAEHARRIRKVLVAGASIGAVERAQSMSGEERYLVRSELFEYLSMVANSARDGDREYADRVRLEQRLEQIVGAALAPASERARNAEIVLQYMEPINQRHGFMAKVDFDPIDERHRRLVRTVLNAGTTVGAVQRHDRSASRFGILARFKEHQLETTYLIRSELFATLLKYSGSAISPLQLDGPAAPQRLNGKRPPARLPSPSLRPDQSELRGEIWSALLGPIGLSLESASRVKDEAVRSQAMSAWQAMQQLSQSNERLRVYLDEIVDAKAEAIDQSYSELRSNFEDAGEHLAILEEVIGDLHRQLRSLLLLPEVGVVREMIDRLEAAIQQDNGTHAEERLLNQLRGLEIAIRHIDKSSAGGWMRVAQMINGNGQDDPATIREMNPVNKTPI